MSRAEQIAYAAGLIDGEGWISVHDVSFRGREAYQLRVAVMMTQRDGIGLLFDLFGGKFYYRPKTTVRKAQDSWMLFGSRADRALRELLPHMRVKQYLASIALSADWTGFIGRPITEEQQAIRRQIAGMTKDLNRRGPR